MKKVKEPAPHVKAAQIEKEAVRALSADEVEEALTASTFGIKETADKITEAFKGASKKAGEVVDAVMTDEMRKNLDVLDEAEEALTKSTYGGEEKPTDDIIVVPDGTPYDIIEKLAEYRRYIKELEGDKEILKTECLALKEENKKYQREIDDYKKTISKMKYAHEEEVRALNDDIMEAKALGKKAGEYCSMLDADSDTFETILELAKIIHGLAKNAESVSLLIKDEVEGHI